MEQIRNLKPTEARRAESLTKRLTCYGSFAEVLRMFNVISFRDINCRKAPPKLMAGWTEYERRQEEIEHNLLLELANLIECAQGAKRRMVLRLGPTPRAS